MNATRDPSEFTQREQQVFDLLQQGYQRLNIAAILGIAPDTVKVYVSRLLEKTGCATALEMVTSRRSPEQRETRKRDLRIRQVQLSHQLAAVNEELAILEEEQPHENEAKPFDLSAHPGGLAGAHADAANLVQNCR